MKFLFAYVFYFILVSSAYAADHTSISSDFNRTKAINFLKAQKYNKLYEYIKPYVKTENSDAMNIHGIIYMNDKNRIDILKAIYWYKKSANKNNFRAMINLGDIYKNGLGIKKDYKKALDYYKKAAELNSTVAMNRIAKMYQIGMGVTKDPISAYIWYLKAADNNDSFAMGNIGYMYQKGIGVAKNYEQAINWYQKSIEHGSTYGFVNIAYAYKEMGQFFNVLKWLKKGADNNNTSAFIELSLIESSQKNYKKSFTWMKKAADANNTYAMMRLSYMFSNGLGTTKDTKKAYDLVKKAAKLNNNEALRQLGNAYYFGYYDQKKNIDIAIDYYKRSIKMGSTMAYSPLAGIYLYGNKQNLKKAYQYNSKSILTQNDTLSQFRLGQMYAKGLWVAQDLEKAKDILEKVVQTKMSKKFGWGLYELGKIYYEQNQTSLGLSYLEKAKILNSRDAENFLKYAIKPKTINKESSTIDKIYFEVDPEGHTGIIFDGLKVNNKNQIVTASHDKTIRVWDLKSNKVVRKILGEIDDGQIGVINAIALSPDDKYLASGGIFSNDIHKSGMVRIYDFASGKILFTLDGLPGSIKRLKFTNDGRFLMSISGTKIKVWDTENWKEYTLFNSFSQEILFFEVVNIGNDNIIFVSDGEHIISFSLNLQMGLNDLSANGKKLYHAVGEQYVYRADENKLEIFDYNLSYVSKKVFDKDISSIHTSPISKYVLLSFSDSSNTSSQELYIHNKDQLNKLTTLNISKNQLFGTRFISKNEVGIANILENSIKIWDLDDRYLKNVLISPESMNSILISYYNSQLTLYNPLGNVKVFDFKNLTLQNDKSLDPSKFKRLAKNTEKYSIKYLGKANPALEIINNFTKETTNLPIGLIFSWGIIEDKYLIVGALDEQSYTSNAYMGKILIFTMQGEKIYELHGHKSAVANFAYDKNQEILFSAGSDGVVKIWDMAKISDKKQAYEYNHNVVDKMMELMQQNLGTFDTKEEFLSVLFGKTKEEHLYLKNFMRNVWYKASLYNFGMKEYKHMLRNYLKKVERVKPLLSFFVSKSNEWVLWTEDGFFDASKNGAKYIGYHINQGFDKEAKFITSDQVYNEFYRPDIVKKALNKEDVSSYAKEINIAKIIKGGFAPEVKFLTRRTVANKRDIDLNAKVCDTGGGIGDVIVSLNGTNIKVDVSNRQALEKENKKDDQCYQVDMLVTLQNGKNELKLFAFNENGTIESDIDSLQIDNKLKQSVKSDLYLLSIAVNKYMDKSLHLKYPVDDASAIEKAMQNITGTLFENTKIIKLYDNNVSKRSIAKVFEQISKKIKPDDVFMMFMAGHGVTDDGKYYFLPYDFKFTGLDSIEKYGVSIDDLKEGLLKIPAQKSLVLLDTCSSGAFTNEIMSRGLEEKMAIARLHRATGRNYIAASSDNQVALEGYEGHGVFTYTIVDALEGKGFNNGKLTVVDLAKYVEDVLPEISYKKWGYMQVPQKSLSGSDFPIGLK